MGDDNIHQTGEDTKVIAEIAAIRESREKQATTRRTKTSSTRKRPIFLQSSLIRKWKAYCKRNGFDAAVKLELVMKEIMQQEVRTHTQTAPAKVAAIAPKAKSRVADEPSYIRTARVRSHNLNRGEVPHAATTIEHQEAEQNPKRARSKDYVPTINELYNRFGKKK